MARRKTIYVSSTFEDLKAHRAALKAELERAGYDVESMERYAAFPEPPLEKCLADVGACDGYVLVLAHRYGFTPTVAGTRDKSITELEYEEAQARGKPAFVFLLDEQAPWDERHRELGASASKLAALRERVREAHGCSTYTTPDNLAARVLAALSSHGWPERSRAGGPALGHYVWPKPWDFSAYMAEKREVFEGREWLFAEIDAWLAAPDQPKALLVRADFGVGKSALLAELVQRNAQGAIAAWHFCQHDTQATLQPGTFVQNVAAQLAAALPGYRELIEADAALQERLDGALADPGSAFESAVLAPLAKLPAPAAPRLIVVDALDEALELDAAAAPGAAPRRSATLVSLLAAKAPRFPPWLRVLATSRPNPQVLSPLQHAFGLKEIDAESASNQDDLRRYIAGRAGREPLAARLHAASRSAPRLADELVPRCQGKFLYAVRAMRDLELGHIGPDELAALPPGMDSFYLDAFERRFRHAGQDYAAARALLGVLATAREPVPAALAAEVLQVGEDAVKAVHRLLPDFLRQRGSERSLTFDHFSLAEWLTRNNDEGFARAGDYAVDLAVSDAAWRRWGLRRVAAGTAHRSDYLLRHLSTHLADDDERQHVCGPLMTECFEWLQARLLQAGVDALLGDAQALQAAPEMRLLSTVLRNGANALRRAPDQLAGQVLGRIGPEGLGTQRALTALTQSAQLRLLEEGNSRHAPPLLLPQRRSLRVSVAQEAIWVGGGLLLAVLPDGRVASGAEDGAVRVWDPVSPAAEATAFEGHTASITALAVLPDGRIASADKYGATLWNPACPTREPTRFAEHGTGVTALAVLPDGRIAVGELQGAVRLWDPEHPVGEHPLSNSHSTRVTVLTVLPDGRVASAANDHTIRLWDPARPTQEPTVFREHTGPVFALALLSDGRIASASADMTIRLWDPACPSRKAVVLEGHRSWVDALAVLPDGRVASGAADNSVRLWDPARPALEPIVLEGHTSSINVLAVLPDGRIASGARDNTVRIWDPARPMQEPVVFEAHSSSVIALAVLPGGRIVSGARDNTVRLWDPARQPPEPVLFEGHSSSVNALAVLPDGRVASGASDGTVRLWEPVRWFRTPVVFRGHTSSVNALAVLPDGRIASGASDKTVRLWNPERPQDEPIVFAGHYGSVDALAVVPNWQVMSGPNGDVIRLRDPAHYHLASGVRIWQSGRLLAMLPDGRIAAVDAGQVRVWNPARPAEPSVSYYAQQGISALVALPDGRIASGSDDNTVWLWEPARPAPGHIHHFLVHPGDGRRNFGRLVQRLNAEPVVFHHRRAVRALAVLRDSRIASGSDDNTIRIWDPARPAEEPIELGRCVGSVRTLAVLPDGRLVSGSDDYSVQLWDPTGHRPTLAFIADAPITCLAVTCNGTIAAGAADGGVHFLRPA